MDKKKLTIEDIFNDDEFGLLESKEKKSVIKTEDDRLIDAFEEISSFVDKHEREPSRTSMSEYSLLAKLKNFRENEAHKKILKPFDRHNLLGHVEIEVPSIDEILEDDDLDLSSEDSDLSLFEYRNIPKPEDRAEADFVAQRQKMSEAEFKKYEPLFHKVHKELKEGKRQIKEFRNAEKNLKEGHFYILDGLLVYLESANLQYEKWENKSGTRVRLEGRTNTIFENSTYSNMLFRSLGKQLHKNGKLITQPSYETDHDLYVDSGLIQEEDTQTGWIYVLKSKSDDPQIRNVENLYKIGFSSTPVSERIRNAKHEATYLFADVQIVSTYAVYNRGALKLESLLHRIFARVCLNIDVYNRKGQKANPREWFIVPSEVIEEAIGLILNGNILEYEYDAQTERMMLKSD